MRAARAVRVHRLHWQVAGVAERAAGLDCAVDHVVEDLGAEVLDHPDLLARRLRPSSRPRAVSSGAASISAAESAMKFWIVCLEASGPPNASRWSARSHMMSKARRDWPG